MPSSLHSEIAARIDQSTARAPSLFATLPEKLQDKLRAGAKKRSYSEGQVVSQRGDDADGFWVIEHGQVKIGNYSDGGEMHALFIMGPGRSFGELACIGGFKRVATAEAIGPLETLWISDKQFMDTIKGDADASETLLRTMAAQLQEAVDGLLELRNVPAPKRLAARLIILSGNSRDPVKLPIRQQELAELIGASRMTVASTLSELEELGFIERQYRSIILKDPKGLRRWTAS